MRVLDGPHQEWPSLEAPTAVTIGVYDGVHLGHRHVITTLADRAAADGLLVTVVTFRQHPATLLAPDRVPPQLTTIDQRLERFAAAGVDVVALLDFDESLRRLSAETFVEDVLVAGLQPRLIAVGEDFRFGFRQQGDVALLERMGTGHGFSVVPVPLVGSSPESGGVPYSATAARTALGRGDLDTVSAILGRPFQVCAEVVAGDGRGRGIGFPTANLGLAPHQAVPRHGVYAVRARIGNGAAGSEMMPGVANVGVRPTFGGSAEVIEVHLLDIDLPLYGEMLCVDFVARVRDEQRFDGIEALVAQIGRDVGTARRLLDGPAD